MSRHRLLISLAVGLPPDRCGSLAKAWEAFDPERELTHIERTFLWSDPPLSTAAARLLVLLRMGDDDPPDTRDASEPDRIGRE